MYDSVILVTGGAKRVGLAIVKSLLSQGYRVVLHCHQSIEEATSVQSEYSAQRLFVVQQNLLAENAVSNIVAKIIAHWGRLDGIVNNASLFYRVPLQEHTIAELAQAHHTQWMINCHTPTLLVKEALPYLQRGDIRVGERSVPPAVVNILDSHSSSHSWQNYSGYAASKAGMMAITQSLAKELAPHIRVNAVGPGLVDCGDTVPSMVAKIPMQRPATLAEIAETVLFVLTGPSYITGQCILVDGGWSLV